MSVYRVCVLAAALFLVAVPSWAGERVTEQVDVSPVWAGHPVDFCLLTHGDQQLVGFYDAERRMTVAQRKLGERAWRTKVLPETLGWDSHNSVAMAVDPDGFVHLSGNMHARPLIYFRTTKPLDVTAFERVDTMVGQNEAKVTYPQFLHGPGGELVFTYRDGGSGNGNQIYDVYDTATRSWRRLLDTPLTDGRGRMNAYFDGPIAGPDGWYHLCWVWRDTPDCSTNHDLSYARSKDLVHWETSQGKPVPLPITLETAEIVAPVPSGGGICNGDARIGFDSEKRVVLSYYKFDENGFTQMYNARVEEGKWVSRQVSDWAYRWEFKGGGAIVTEIGVEPARYEPGVGLTQGYRHIRYGTGTWLLDEATLRPKGPAPPADASLEVFRKVESDFPGMCVNTVVDSGSSGIPGVRFVIRWETLGPNRDRPREAPWPAAPALRVYRIERQ